MKKVKSSKDLKEKMLFLLCLGALAGTINTEVYSDTKVYDSSKYPEIFEETESLIREETGITDGINVIDEDDNNNITVNFNNKIEIKTNEGNGLFVSANGNAEEAIANINKNINIISEKGYALYAKAKSTSGAGATAGIVINGYEKLEEREKNIVQIIGDIKAESISEPDQPNDPHSETKIVLNLNNSYSFFAGKMETEESTKHNGTATSHIKMNLENEATWYAQDSNGTDSYTIDGSDKNLKTTITSNGGVIDTYNYTPNKNRVEYLTEQKEQEIKDLEEQLNKIRELDEKKILDEILERLPDEDPEKILEEILGEFQVESVEDLKESLVNSINGEIDKIGKDIITIEKNERIGTRKFTLNGVEHNLKNTTFRISSDVENKTSDLITLNGVNTEGKSETYYIQIVADPFENGEWKVQPGEKIQVMDINGKNPDTDLSIIEVEGKEYTASVGAGLLKQTITPTIEEDKDGSGDWFLTGLTKTEAAEEKGDGHIFAELGTAVNAGMAAAWRADNSDLYQRMGNLRNKEAEQGVWGRIYTGENEVRKGMDLNLEYRAVQVGYDRKEKTDEGKLFTGIAFGYFDGETDYNHGSGEADSATVGLYATYMGDNGTYGDFIIKYGNLDNELSYRADDGNYYKADYDTYGISADAEYGYRHELDNNYYIEPLAQLSYIYIADEEYTMELNGKEGARVSNDDYQSLIGYAGFHYGKQFENNNAAYLRVAVAHEFMGDIDVSARYQNIHVKSDINGDDTWVEYGVGFDAMVKEDTALYGRVQRSTGDVVRTKWHASLGIRYIF